MPTTTSLAGELHTVDSFEVLRGIQNLQLVLCGSAMFGSSSGSGPNLVVGAYGLYESSVDSFLVLVLSGRGEILYATGNMAQWLQRLVLKSVGGVGPSMLGGGGSIWQEAYTIFTWLGLACYSYT